MKILLVDDHKLIKMGIKVLLEDYPKYKDVDECSTKAQFFKKFSETSYDLIICDISLPDGTGYEIIESVRKLSGSIKIIVLSMHEDKSYIKKALKLGANGYVTKSNAHNEIITAINTVFDDETYLSSKYSNVFYELYKEQEQRVELSDREKEVANYIVQGYTLTDIAEKLYLSVKTVDTYKKRVMEKTNTKKRSELVEYFKNNFS